jgi:hypothetical protein
VDTFGHDARISINETIELADTGTTDMVIEISP